MDCDQSNACMASMNGIMVMSNFLEAHVEDECIEHGNSNPQMQGTVTAARASLI